MAIGGLIGGAIDPTKITGPHIGDGQAQSATDGTPISWVMGTMWVAGTIVDVGPRQEFKVKQDTGKGSGTEQYNYEAHQNFSIVVCESDELKGSTIDQVLMVEQDGKIVYDVRPGSTMLVDSQKWLARNCIFYYGGEAQLPTAADEGAHGVGNAPAYRGVLRAFFTQFNVTAVGDRIPNFRFLVSQKTLPKTTLPTSATVTYSVVPPSDDNNRITGAWQVIPIDSAFFGNDTQVVREQINIENITFATPQAMRVYVEPIFDDEVTASSGAYGPDNVKQYFTAPSTAFDFGWIGDYNPDLAGQKSMWEEAWTYLGMQPPYINVVDVGTELPGPLFDAGKSGSVVTGIRLTIFQHTRLNRLGCRMNVEYISYASNNPTLTFIGNSTWQDTTSALFVSPFALSPTAPTTLQLSTVVSAITSRGGMKNTVIDVADFGSATVAGYAIAKQMNAVSALGPLLGAYFAYASEYDSKINFHFYGADAVMTIDEADILAENDANNGNITSNLRNNATEFPKRIIGQYYDPAQNYMPVTVMQTRRAVGVTATGELSMDIPVVTPANQAQQAVDKALKVAYAQLEGTLELSVPFAGKDNVYLSLVAGDPVIFRGKRWIVTEPIISTGYIKLTLQYDRQSAYTSDVQAIPGLDPTPPQSRYSGPTTLVPMNLPSLRTQDIYGVYLAAKGTNDQDSWRGCNVLVSYDGQQSWQNATVIALPSVIGTLDVEIPSGGEPLTLNIGEVDQLESITDQQIAAQMNAFAMGGADGFEIGQFKTTVQLSDGDWEITDVSRGLNGTTEGTHVVGDPFVMLDSVYFLPIDPAFAGKTIYFRAVGFGEVAEDQPVVSLVYDPDTTIIYDGGNASTGT